MRVIALTGSAGAGKSTVGGLFRRWGAHVIDADALVREMQRPGEPVFDAIVAAFGDAVLDERGELDRAQLRRRILADAVERRRLEAIVHPALEIRRRATLDVARERGEQLVIAEIPLLFEAGLARDYDGVIVVDAPVEERRRRLMHDRALTRNEADGLIAAQLPSSVKRADADWIIDNDAGLDVLEARARSVWEHVAS